MRYAAIAAVAFMLVQPARAEKAPEIDPRAQIQGYGITPESYT